MEKRTESKVKDKAVKLAGGSVMDDFGIIMASQTHGRGGYFTVPVFYIAFTMTVAGRPAKRGNSP